MENGSLAAAKPCSANASFLYPRPSRGLCRGVRRCAAVGPIDDLPGRGVNKPRPSSSDGFGGLALVGETSLLIAGWTDAWFEALGAPVRIIRGERFWRLDAVNARLAMAGQTGNAPKPEA